MRCIIYFLAILIIFTGQNCTSNNNNSDQPSEAARKKMEAGLDTLTGMPKRAENPYQTDGCSLLPDADFQAIFGINPATEVNKRTLKNESFCLWVWKRADWKERETYNDKNKDFKDPECRIAVKATNYGLESDAATQFSALKNADAQELEGLSAPAIWVAARNNLVVLEKSFNIIITVEVADDASENLAKAKAIVPRLLSNMKR